MQLQKEQNSTINFGQMWHPRWPRGGNFLFYFIFLNLKKKNFFALKPLLGGDGPLYSWGDLRIFYLGGSGEYRGGQGMSGEG